MRIMIAGCEGFARNLSRVVGSFPFAFDHFSVQILDLLPRPGRAAEEFEAGGHAGIAPETIDGYPNAQHFPSIVVNQVFQNHLERLAMQWIGILMGHAPK